MKTFFRFNTPFGLLMGLVFSIATYTASNVQDKILNCDALNSTISILCIIGLYIQIKNYRDKIFDGTISYGIAICTGLWIVLLAAIINSGTIIYLYETNIELFKNYIAYTQEMVNELPDNTNKKIMLKLIPYITPAILGIFDFIFKIVVGTLYTLIISLFTRRKMI